MCHLNLYFNLYAIEQNKNNKRNGKTYVGNKKRALDY